MARASWIAMLGYFAFVFVTLLGVEDADFFVPSRQTQLPLVNVAIPTASFFWFAPPLGAALYVYLHIVLLKLWDAIADLEKPRVDGHPVGDLINPWLANDWALSQRGGDFTPARPLRVLGNFATFALVWLAGVLVLASAWWRSMPAHNEYLTLWLGFCLIFASLAGFDSERAARSWLASPRQEPVHRPFRRICALIFSIFIIIITSWARTEGSYDRYIVRLIEKFYKQNKDKNYEFKYIDHNKFIEQNWVIGPENISINIPAYGIYYIISKAEFKAASIIPRRDDWKPAKMAQDEYLSIWCSENKLKDDLCEKIKNTLIIINNNEPKNNLIPSIPKKIKEYEKEFEKFLQDWNAERENQIVKLPRLNMQGQDLRFASAEHVLLEGADLRNIWLDSANLGGAWLERATLRHARARGVRLKDARLEAANLREAQLQHADLTGAILTGADLNSTTLEGADLDNSTMSLSQIQMSSIIFASVNSVNLQKSSFNNSEIKFSSFLHSNLTMTEFQHSSIYGADFGQATLQDANFLNSEITLANMDRADLRGTDFSDAMVKNALLIGADLRGAKGLTHAQLDRSVGDATTLLPYSEGAEPLHVWSCTMDTIDVFNVSQVLPAREAWREEPFQSLWKRHFCGPDTPRVKTGTPWPLDAPRPEGHPLGP